MEIGGNERCGKCGKSEAFFAELFPSTRWKSSNKKLAEGPPLSISTGAAFSTARRRPDEFSRFVVRKFLDTPSPLRINVTDC